MKRYLLLIAFLFVTTLAFGQGYTQALGIRGGLTPGVEYRYYTSDKNSLKALVGIRDRGLQLYALTEFYQFDLFPFSYQLVFFYGFGLHGGYESWDEERLQNGDRSFVTRSSLLAGVDGLVGLEYIFYEAPVILGVEAKPYVDVFGREDLKIQPFDFAFTVKYIF